MAVIFKRDNTNEMLSIEFLDGSSLTGNFWDFDFMRDGIDVLRKCGVEVIVEDYEDEDE